MSKRDQIWEQKRRAREDRLKGGNVNYFPKLIGQTNPQGDMQQNHYDMNPNFQKYESFPQQDYNMPVSENPQNFGRRGQIQDNWNQPQNYHENYMPDDGNNDYYPPNNGKGAKGAPFSDRGVFENQRNQQQAPQNDINSYQKVTGDEKRKKAEYGEFLKQQMREKAETKIPQSQPSQNAQLQAPIDKSQEKKKKKEYGEFLREQMKQQQDARKSSELERKNIEVDQGFQRREMGSPNEGFQRPQPQTYQQIVNNYQNNVGMQNNRTPPPTYQQQNNYQNNDMMMPPQNYPPQQNYQQPQNLNNFKNVDQYQNNVPQAPQSYQPTYDDGEKKAGIKKMAVLQSDHPDEMARRDRLKQDFQRGLQDQIEERKRIKKLEEEKKRQEDLMELEKLRKEQEELNRKYEQEKENEKKKNAAFQRQNEPVVQEPPVKGRRRRQQEPVEQNIIQEMVVQENIIQEKPRRGGRSRREENQEPESTQEIPNSSEGRRVPNLNMQQMQMQQMQQMQYGQPPVNHEINKIRSEIQNQQNVLSKQLEMIKNEAAQAMEDRNRAENELLNLREQLKQKVLSEELYKQNLRRALENNAQQKVQTINNELLANNMAPLGSSPFEPYNMNINLPAKRGPIKILPPQYQNGGSNGNLGNPISGQTSGRRGQNLDLLYSQGEFNNTLAHDTKYIPLTVFDGRQQKVQANAHPLTLSKLQEFAIRPNSSNPGNPGEKQNDIMDAHLKNSNLLRPSSSEHSRDLLDTTNLIGKKLDEAEALIQMYNNVGGGGLFDKSRTNLYGGTGSRHDVLSSAGKNVLGGFGTQKSNPQMRFDSRDSQRSLGHDFENLDKGNKFKGTTSNGLEGIPISNRDLFSVHGGDTSSTSSLMMDRDMSNGLNGLNMSHGSTFNLDNINLANEQRLKNLERMGSGGGLDTVKSKGNYFGGGANNRLLETIREDDDDEIAKLDKLLLTYGRQ